MDIIQEKKRYFHLNDATVITLFTEFCIIDAAGGDRTRKKRDLAKQLGCSLSTIYRIFRQSRVILAYPSDIRKEPVPKEVLDCNAILYARSQGRKKSCRNASKGEKALSFMLACVAGLGKDNSKVTSVDEVVHTTAPIHGQKVSTKTLYKYIEVGSFSDYPATRLPRYSGWKRKPKNFKEYTKKEARGTSISERPEEIATRTTFGNWEGDLVTGPRDGKNGAFLTLIERQTRYYLMIKILDKRAESVNAALYTLKENNPRFHEIFKTITFDNGAEFSEWREMEEKLSIKTYFGRPYHSGDRGSNENCNGFIRRTIKKGTDINTISREQTIELNRAINNKRRKLFQYRSARDMFFSRLKNIGIGSNEVYLYQW